jgi:CDP-diglyceride synthetase
MLRDRVRRAAILVPPLFVALWLGGGWILLVVAIATVIGAYEAFRLLTAAGHASMSAMGIVLALVIALAIRSRCCPAARASSSRGWAWSSSGSRP